MTSKQVMLTTGLIAWAVGMLSGCDYRGSARDDRASAPYDDRQVWAVAPLRNEAGSRYADGVRMADHLTRELTLVHGIETIPVNRVLATMDAMDLPAVTSKGEALALRQALGVDGLVAGSLTAWDPYDPPKIGIAVELYLDPVHASRYFDVRKLTGAATGDQVVPGDPYRRIDQPVSAVSAFYDAADPIVREQLEDYGEDRGTEGRLDHNHRLYRISMDLYSEFVSHQVGSRLLHAERVRVTPAPPQAGTRQNEDDRLTQASPR